MHCLSCRSLFDRNLPHASTRVQRKYFMEFNENGNNHNNNSKKKKTQTIRNSMANLCVHNKIIYVWTGLNWTITENNKIIAFFVCMAYFFGVFFIGCGLILFVLIARFFSGWETDKTRIKKNGIVAREKIIRGWDHPFWSVHCARIWRSDGTSTHEQKLRRRKNEIEINSSFTFGWWVCVCECTQIVFRIKNVKLLIICTIEYDSMQKRKRRALPCQFLYLGTSRSRFFCVSEAWQISWKSPVQYRGFELPNLFNVFPLLFHTLKLFLPSN